MKNLIKRTSIIFLSIITLVSMTGCFNAKTQNGYKYNDFSKYVKLGKYKNLKYHTESRKVTESEVEKFIEESMKSNVETKEIKSGTAMQDSKVKIDYEGKINGKTFDGGAATDATVDIKNSSYIPGFAEGIIGHSVGETFDVKLTFPENYQNGDVAGKNVVFKIKLKAILENITPEYNDEYVRKVSKSKYKTVAEYNKFISKRLAKDKDRMADVKEYNELFAQVMNSSKIKKYPDKELKLEKKRIKGTYEDMAKKNKMSYKDFIKKQMGMNEKTVDKEIDKKSKEIVKQKLIIYALADELNIKVTSAEYNKKIKEELKNAGYTEKSFKKAQGQSIKQYASEKDMYTYLVYEKTMNKIKKMSKNN